MGRMTNTGEPATNKERAILEAALVLFAAHGVEGTSMNQIADAVGIRKPTIYHYFPGKEAIVEAIFQALKLNAGWVREQMADREAPLERRLALVGETFLGAMRKRPELQAFLVRESIGGVDSAWRGQLRSLLRGHLQGRIDALAENFTQEIDGLATQDAEMIAGHFFHSMTNFWLSEGHVAVKPPSWKRCQRYVALLARGVALQLESNVVAHET